MSGVQEKIILISGVNGYIAAQIARAFLDAGFKVRGTSRSRSSSAILTEGPLKSDFEAGRFEVVEVPDITVAGAFDEAVKGVYAIAHTATPVSMTFTDPEPILHAAVNGTKSILESSLKAGPQLKLLIFMSSIAAIWSNNEPPYTYTEKDWNNASEALVSQLGKNAPGPQIYIASKAAAEKAFWKFRDDNKPSAAYATINPVLVTGPPLALPKDPSNIGETVRNIWQIFSGQEYPPPLIPDGAFYVDVRDVARLFVWAAQHPEEVDGERYIAFGEPGSEQRIADVLRENYPERRNVIKEGTPGVYPPFAGIGVDNSKAIKATGQAFIGYDQSVLDAAKAFEVYL
ncbi:hypothetical protein B0A52_03107 [Exophiala mesophila]|uniref:NAD-dependent epimerase/dehydratase domain-containing protein n=1 Tax=Exophiala mesophila TaxID=212818 RepID=A0A438NCG0_EXOME|nr:hypothetical protein B0A52_03107 [Exophiala mesophila]